MKASELVIKKLREVGGDEWITLLNGDEARVSIGGRDYFVSDKLPYQNVEFSIFDIVVDFLKKQPHGRALKAAVEAAKSARINVVEILSCMPSQQNTMAKKKVKAHLILCLSLLQFWIGQVLLETNVAIWS